MIATALIDGELVRQRVRELPALPQAALDALAMLRDDQASNERCAELIGRDQALAARTLRLANSAFYGVPGRVGSIRDAVYLLGRRTLSSLLAVASVSNQFKATACPAFSFSGFWRHATAVAMASRGIALAMKRDGDQAFTVGLLHDIGRLALATYFPQQLAVAMGQVQELDRDLPAAERPVLGTDHAQIGAQVAAQWNFPPEVVQAIAGHHAPQPAGGGASLADMVHVADAMAHALDLADNPDELVPAVDPEAWNRLALNVPAMLKILRDTETGVTELCQALGLQQAI
jgi:putative nucleotidyltransferase with HDIG domain